MPTARKVKLTSKHGRIANKRQAGGLVVGVRFLHEGAPFLPAVTLPTSRGVKTVSSLAPPVSSKGS